VILGMLRWFEPRAKQTREAADRLIAEGNRAESAGNLARARDLYGAAVAAAPRYARAHLNLGIALEAEGRLDGAAESYEAALVLEPGEPYASYNLGKLLAARGIADRAEQLLRSALSAKPEFPEALVALANLCESGDRLPEALAALETAVKQRPAYAGAWYNRALLLQRLGRLDEAEDALRRVLGIDPKFPLVHHSLGNLLRSQGRIGEAIERFGTARKLDPASFDVESAELHTLIYSDELAADELAGRHRAFGARLEAHYPERFAPFHNAPDPDRRLRIGCVSSNLSMHPVALFLLPLLEHRDRAAYEIHCYSTGRTQDPVTARIRERCDGWREAAFLSDDRLAETVNGDGIDILIDLTGHAGLSRLAVFAQRPAPVAAGWLGYLGTTGLTRVQYRLCDSYSDPPGLTESLHTETLVRLPHSQWCYRPFLSVDAAPEPPLRRNGFVTFGSFNHVSKLSASTLALWRRILDETPGSRLVVVGVPEGRASERLRRDFHEAGISASRLSLVPRVPLDEYFRRFDDVDIALDTAPCSGGTTTCDTLWMGVPVVTLPGPASASRSAASLLSTLGLTEWIAATPGEYVRIASAAAREPAVLAGLRGSLRERMRSSPLMNERGFARDFEGACRRMWRDWCESSTGDSVEAHFRAAETLRMRGRPDEAIFHHRRIVALLPDSPIARSNLGNALADRAPDEAIACYREAIRLDPGFPEAHSNLAAVLRDHRRLAEAIACGERAVALRPNFPEALANLGNALKDAGRLDDAVRAYRRALEVRWDADTHSSLLFALNHAAGLSPADLYAEHRGYARRLGASGGPRRHPNSPDPGRRLRVGYVSGDFRTHPVAHFIEPVLAGHDRDRFEVFCYYNHGRSDEVTERLRRHATRWRDVSTLDDDALVRLVGDDAVDLLVDLSGHTGKNRLPVFARKPAPVQATWLGYLNTTGLDAVDYRISDGSASPAGFDAFHSERLVRLPHSQWCYRAPAASPDVTDRPSARPRVTFAAFSNLAKIGPPVVDLWSRLLARVQGSELWLVCPGMRSVAAEQLERFVRRGVDPARVRLGDIRPFRQYLELHGEVDVMLDTFPYAGGTTTCHALWMGVPVVSLVGDTAPSRGGASLLGALGLDELVARTPEDYVDIAARLAGDRARLAALRSRLRARMAASPLMDEQGFVRDLESAYRAMWSSWCGGRRRV
jgi:predicted O-linked N-acetylglucosamine transferase (SPINDLY family)